ncbi:hypothetical protein D9Q98_000857 [Chlorella vulgaris]|uniref:carnosine N-methyltransferase n=1 Tax=Chlorella vulgaris TaxID=3077 RepID=A0A9D4TYT3_CHLVU|nr:hypothetical protein D9Q98_000857 [Chlorella vulgaris]
MPGKIAEARQCIYRNHLFLSAMLAMFVEGEDSYAPPHLAPANAAADELEAKAGSCVAPYDHDRVRYVLKNVARDWSEEGAPERAQSYGRICAELRRLFAGRPAAAGPPSVLVPGAGLARLCLEIVNLGFQAEGNEFSYHMLLASAYLLNGVDRKRQWSIHPWVHSSCNHLSTEDQLRAVQVPDVHPASLVPGPGLLSMSAGDFGEVYAGPQYASCFDAVAACFFLDTAHNILQYLQVIWHVLKPGGHLVNLGPLLYHWAEAGGSGSSGGEQQSVELSLEEVKAAALQLGFRLVRDELVDAAFLANQRSMMQGSTYRCSFFTLQKPEAGRAAQPPVQRRQQQQQQQAAA